MPCFPCFPCCPCLFRAAPKAKRTGGRTVTINVPHNDSSDEEVRTIGRPSRSSVGSIGRRYTEAGGFGEGDVFDDISAEFWPALRGFIEDHVLLGIVESSLKKLIWSRTKFTRCSLGKTPPRIWGSKSHRVENSSERTVELAMDVDFDGEDVDIEVLVDHGLKATISKVAIRGTFCIEMRNFLRELPLLTGMTLYFMNPPEVSITFGGLLGPVEHRILSVSKIIEKQLAANLVVPNRLTLHLAPQALSYDEVRYPAPKGMLDVRLHGATGVSVAQSWASTRQLVQVELRLGAEQYNSPARLVDKTGSVTWEQSWSVFVDYPHGQTLMAELRPVASRVFLVKDALIGQTKLSVAQVSSATEAEQNNWPLETGDQAASDPVLSLSGVYRPLITGSSLGEGRQLEPLSDGTRGVVMIVLECVRDLGAALEGHRLECVVRVGDSVVETRRSVASRASPSDMGPAKEDKLRLLLTGTSKSAVFNDADAAHYSPETAAWIMGMDLDATGKVAAIARRSVEAEFRQPLRLRVKDPFKDGLTIELQRGRSRKTVVARFAVRIQDLLAQKNWTLPMTERHFNEVPSDGMNGRHFAPKFVARIQFLGVSAAAEALPGREPSAARRKGSVGKSPGVSCAVERRRQTLQNLGRVEKSDSSGDELSPNMEDKPSIQTPCCAWPIEGFVSMSSANGRSNGARG